MPPHNPRVKAPHPNLGPEKHPKISSLEAEGTVQTPAGIADLVQVVQAVLAKEIPSELGFAHVGEHNRGSGRFYVTPLRRKVGQRFPTKGASGMPEEDQQYRSAPRQSVDGSSSIGTSPEREVQNVRRSRT
jgi:hypothetical protein